MPKSPMVGGMSQGRGASAAFDMGGGVSAFTLAPQGYAPQASMPMQYSMQFQGQAMPQQAFPAAHSGGYPQMQQHMGYLQQGGGYPQQGYAPQSMQFQPNPVYREPSNVPKAVAM
jgi:hypothetical protein